MQTADFWEETFDRRSLINVTYIAEGLGGFIQVVTAPYFVVDFPAMYNGSILQKSSELVRVSLDTLWDKIESFVLKNSKERFCSTKALTTLRERKDAASHVTATVERLCQHPNQLVEPFVIVVGLVIVFFFALLRNIVPYIFTPRSTPKAASPSKTDAIKESPASSSVVNKRAAKKSK